MKYSVNNREIHLHRFYIKGCFIWLWLRLMLLYNRIITIKMMNKLIMINNKIMGLNKVIVFLNNK